MPVDTDPNWAAPAVEDVDRGVERSDTEHARDALFRHGRGGTGGECRDPAVSGSSPFGGGADLRALGAALRRLRPAERRVVRMRLSGHESADTIAAVLGLPRPDVTLLLTQGLSRIRHDLLT